MIEQIFDISKALIDEVSMDFQREQFAYIQDHTTPLALVGHRGVGKTYLMLQICKQFEKSMYISADHLIVHSLGLRNIVQKLVKEHDKKLICIDEIHLYPKWQQELKNILDAFPRVRFLISGSNSIHLSA